MFFPVEVSRDGGMMRPGKSVLPASGSFTVHSVPLVWREFEKSPWRSKAVGTVIVRVPYWTTWRWNSWLKKKNNLFLRLGSFGRTTGPLIR